MRFSPSLGIRVSVRSLAEMTFSVIAFIRPYALQAKIEYNVEESKAICTVQRSRSSILTDTLNARGHIVTKTGRRGFLAQRKPSAGFQNARKFRCRTHFLNESLHTYPISLVSGSITPEHRADDEAIRTGVKAYLNVLIVAIPFSTVSGVPVRSWEPSRGAIFVA